MTSKEQSFFSLPYDMAAVRPLRQTTRAQRETALKEAAFNTELLSQEMVYIDLRNDVAVAPAYAFAQREKIRGLARIEPPGRSRHLPALFALIESG
ncbi:MAG: hypothetical protein ACREQW_25005 [Candidatus Binatia bacterium]